MADILASATAHQHAQQLLSAAAVRVVARQWRRLSRGDLTGSWRSGPGQLIVSAVTGAQAEAASRANDYVTAVLLEQDASDPVGSVVSNSFAGTASDGRRLDELLYLPVLTAKTHIGHGASVNRAMGDALTQLLLMTETQVTDAGRVADGVATVANPKAGGYVRMLNPPSCPRCAILAGKFYRYNTGFQRHPRCDCRHIPARESIAGDLTTSARRMFDAGKINGLTRAETAAIRDGADIAKVINARRGGYSLQVAGLRVRATREAAGRQVRLMPEQIYADAQRLGLSRTEVIRQLERFGYLRTT